MAIVVCCVLLTASTLGRRVSSVRRRFKLENREKAYDTIHMTPNIYCSGAVGMACNNLTCSLEFTVEIVEVLNGEVKKQANPNSAKVYSPKQALW